MAKYSRDLDESLVEKVKELSTRYGLSESGIKVEALSLNKLGNQVGEIVKGNDLLKLHTGKDYVAIALNQACFDVVDDQTQEMWIEELLSQVYYDAEKEKVIVNKPEITITAGMYNKYKELAVDKAILAQLTVEQIKEQEKERKEQEKLLKKPKKQ